MWSTPAAGACSDHLIFPYRPRGVHVQASLIVLIAPFFGPSFDLPLGYGDIYEVRTRLRCVRKERSLGQAGQEGVWYEHATVGEGLHTSLSPMLRHVGGNATQICLLRMQWNVGIVLGRS